jgi:Protein of unknown function (DUF2457)
MNPSYAPVGVLSSPNTRAIQNQPTSTADSASEDMVAEADEPPDDQGLSMISKKQNDHSKSTFQKSSYPVGKRHSLLTQFLHTSESDSSGDEDDIQILSHANRTQSSTSTYSRSSATSMGELTSDGGHTSPRTSTPSPTLPNLKFTGLPPVFNHKPFHTNHPTIVDDMQQATPKAQLPASDVEKKVEAGLGRKRCIMFACPNKTAPKETAPQPAAAQKSNEPPSRPRTLKFDCPTRRDADNSTTKTRARLASPPPQVKRSQAPPKAQTSDAAVKTDLPKSPNDHRKILATALRSRRESGASDLSYTEATRFHEFAGSEQEDDDWTKEKGCFQRRLTIDDTLEKELGLRKLGREVEEEEDDEEDVGEDEEMDDEIDDDDDDDEDIEDGEHLKRSIASGYESDDGFQTDDEHGFARSDDEDDNDSDNDWWTPGGANKDQIEHIRRSPRLRRSDSESSTESVHPIGLDIPGKVRRQRSRPMNVQNQAPELPDSTDFVCGTLDEDKPLEQAYFNHLQQRRAAKHRAVPQDIDPTFPTSDPEIDDEEDEVSEQDDAIDSDHPIFLHGQMELHDESEDQRRSHWVIPKKRSPLHSPKRLRSPPPAKRISLHRSPPPAHVKRARSPAPLAFNNPRLSSSVPRNHPYKMAGRFPPSGPDHTSGTVIMEEDDNTPRFNRGAIDISMGLEKKRERRREKMYERHCRMKASQQKGKERRQLAPGKGAEKMRYLGLGLNAYRGKKTEPMVGPNKDEDAVHMLSY